jgi:hypothetical protein
MAKKEIKNWKEIFQKIEIKKEIKEVQEIKKIEPKQEENKIIHDDTYWGKKFGKTYMRK